MKTLKIAAVTGGLVATMAAPAAAYPVKHPKLIANALYEAGALPETTCTEAPVKRNDRKLARAYFDGVIACLETTWEQHLTDAGLGHEKIKVRYVNRIPKKYCDFDGGNSDSQAWYCADNRTAVVQLGKDWLDEPDDLWLFYQATVLYSVHVQNIVGIERAYQVIPYGKKAESLEQHRRLNLQTDCLTGVFLRSVWPLAGRKKADWEYLLTLIQGDGRNETRWFGRTGTIKAWMRAGFATGDPGSCNTWKASSAKVA